MTTIWQKKTSIDELQRRLTPPVMTNVGFEFTEIGTDFLEGRVKVDANTHQPMGILHGGVICLLAENIGSVAAYLCTPHENDKALGQSLNANYFRPTTHGWATARATPIHLGRTSHVWDISVTNDERKIVAVVTFTVAIRRFD